MWNLHASLDARRGIARRCDCREKTCKTVTKKVHGKKKRVKVCKTVKPKPTATPEPTPTSTPPVIAASQAVVASIDVGKSVAAIAVGEGAVWVANVREGTITRIDPTTNEVVATISIPHTHPRMLAVGGGAVWVADQEARDLFKINPQTNGVTSIPLPEDIFGTPPYGGAPWGASTLAVDHDSLWIAAHWGDTVLRMDLQSNRIVATIPVPGDPEGIAFTDDTVWVALHHEEQVARIDPQRNTVVALVDGFPNAAWLAAGEGAVWVLGEHNQGSLTVSQLDPQTNREVRVLGLDRTCAYDDDTCPFSLVSAAGALWVLTGEPEGLARIDPHTLQITAILALHYKRVEPCVPPDSLSGERCEADRWVAFGDGSLWVPSDPHTIARVDPGKMTG